MSSSPSRSGTKKRVPWWIWPNLIGIDAPIVAVCWALAILRVNQREPDVWKVLSLFLAVWTIYLLDRWFDARHPEPEPNLRHEFGKRHRPMIGSAAAVIGVVALMVAALKLDYLTLFGGLTIAVLIGGYFFVFVWLARWPGKELGCGLGFGCGVMLAAGEQAASPIALGLIAVATVNCLVIRFAEDLAPSSPWLKGMTGGLAAAVPLGYARLAVEHGVSETWPLDLALSLSALLLVGLWLAEAKGKATARAVRVLADVALVIPLVLVWLR